MIYAMLCFILALGCSTNIKLITKVNSVLIFLFLSGAYSYGYDWIRYREYYENVFLAGDTSTWLYEPGFSLIMFMTKSFSLDYQWVVITCSLILTINLYEFALKNKYRNFCLFYCFCIFGFMEFAEQIRQGVAITFVLVSTYYLSNEKNKKFVIYVLLASMFHVSSILCLAFWPLKKIYRKFNPVIITLIMVLIGGISIYAFKFIIENINLFGVSGFIAEKLQGYASSDGSDSGILSFGLLLNIMVICVAALSTQVNRSHHYLAVFFSVFVIESKAISIAYRFSYYGYTFIYESFEWMYGLRKARIFNRLALITILLVFAFKPLLNPVYREIFNDYHSYWLSGIIPLPDFREMRTERCSTLVDNGIQYCGDFK
ncbi:EpsG family protein [Erwinia sp. S38]|uniref:EpsG family protein n=1 Tax=Erwinia sp. S38 TaxID=2769338 RepID=UPI00190C9BB1|nr:EpsG family protein [Erwinia sp. S38]MBK0002136.1 EpsG family protein [Erwinia sp. S38]